VVKMIEEEYNKLIREKKFCPLCKTRDNKDVKLIKKTINDSSGKRLAYCCPLKHGSLYRIKRLN